MEIMYPSSIAMPTRGVKRPQRVPTDCLVVRNLPPEKNTVTELSNHFQQFGTIINIRVRHLGPGQLHCLLHRAHTYICIYAHICTHTHAHAYVHACMHMYIHAHIHTCTRICTCMHAYVHTCTHTHMYTHTHVHLRCIKDWHAAAALPMAWLC